MQNWDSWEKGTLKYWPQICWCYVPNSHSFLYRLYSAFLSRPSSRINDAQTLMALFEHGSLPVAYEFCAVQLERLSVFPHEVVKRQEPDETSDQGRCYLIPRLNLLPFKRPVHNNIPRHHSQLPRRGNYRCLTLRHLTSRSPSGISRNLPCRSWLYIFLLGRGRKSKYWEPEHSFRRSLRPHQLSILGNQHESITRLNKASTLSNRFVLPGRYLSHPYRCLRLRLRVFYTRCEH